MNQMKMENLGQNNLAIWEEAELENFKLNWDICAEWTILKLIQAFLIIADKVEQTFIFNPCKFNFVGLLNFGHI